jgi:hypothetical protein
VVGSCVRAKLQIAPKGRGYACVLRFCFFEDAYFSEMYKPASFDDFGSRLTYFNFDLSFPK